MAPAAKAVKTQSRAGDRNHSSGVIVALRRGNLGCQTARPDVLHELTDEGGDDRCGLVIQMNMIRQQFQAVVSRNCVPTFALHEVLDNPEHLAFFAFIRRRCVILRLEGARSFS